MVRMGYERVICERWFGDWTKTATYWPPALLAIAALLSHPAGKLNRGPRGPSSLLGLVLNTLNWPLTPNSDLQLTRTFCSTGLYNCLTTHLRQWASHLHSIQPVHSQGDPLISLTGCTYCLHRWISYLTARPGRSSICYVYFEVLFTNPSARAGYDTRSIFKRSLTGLNSEFSFS